MTSKSKTKGKGKEKVKNRAEPKRKASAKPKRSGKRVWTTEEKTLLMSRMPEYKDRSITKNYRDFWPSITAQYLEKFPVIAKIYPGRKYDDLCQQEKDDLAEELEDTHAVRTTIFLLGTTSRASISGV